MSNLSKKLGCCLFLIAAMLLECNTAASVIKRDATTATDEARARLEAEARVETEAMLNALFRAQIEYFSKVKESLNPQTQRAHDIEAYTTRLNQAIAVKNIEEKDQMWLNIFTEFSKSPLLLNNQNETGLTNTEYERILTNSGIQDIANNLLADITAYFWKMAKASGKVVSVAVDEYIKGKRDGLLSFFKNKFN